jgi:3-deoxy-manno-octulosonate cytidylyltransferase (CMP-KDO synthetase)
MIEHVLRRAQLCRRLEAVYVATCDDEIRVAIESIGGSVLMTAATHERASDRTAEAAGRIEADIVVMIQGDEPMITPEMIERAIAPLEDQRVQCVNLVKRISSRAEYLDPNTIKVVRNSRGQAAYFSRSPIPYSDFPRVNEAHVFKQVCVIPFRRAFLLDFARLAPTPLERTESIDMLRILEHGGAVQLIESETETFAVDTPEDLIRVERAMRDDPLLQRYGEATARGLAV